MEDPGGSTAAGKSMIQDALNTTTNEIWEFTYNGSGYYTIVNGASSLYLTSGPTSDRPVVQETSNAGPTQLWSLKEINGNWVVKNKSSGLVLADPGSSKVIGSVVSVYAESDPLWQQWTIK
jgi:hypothetical protein